MIDRDREQAMRAAIAVARTVHGTTSPNPPVGAVIVAPGGEIVGTGATRPPGGAHAEVMALREAGARARGATAFVTLEPCAHHGRTPPCTEALADAGIVAVHYAAADPNPAASGGTETLRARGIDVTAGLLAEEVERGSLRAWLHYARTGSPHVTWKYASTLDGRVAAADGTSRWISGVESRTEVHSLRQTVDAIVVGTGTVRADDPHLTARDADGSLLPRQPLRVVVGTTDPPAGAKVFDDAARTVRLRTRDPHAVLAELRGLGVVDVLLEGGPTLAGAFAEANAIDRILAYLAPMLLGSGPAALGAAGVSTITGAHHWTVEEVTMSGSDVRISAVPAPRAGGN